MAPRKSRVFLGRWARKSPEPHNGEAVGEDYDVNEAFLTDQRELPAKPQQRAVRYLGWSVAAVLVLLLLLNIQNLILRAEGVPPGLWSRNGELVIGPEIPFNIKGFSWYGLEVEHHVLGGLLYTSVNAVLNFAGEHDFNAMRIPLAYDNYENNPVILDHLDALTNVHYGDSHGLKYREFMRRFVKDCARSDKLVMFDLHRLEARNPKLSGLWYSSKVAEDDVVSFWESVCDQHYRDWNVIGADLTNEPYNAIWDSSKSVNNWKRASVRIATALHKRCPHWLIVIEGMGKIAKPYKDDPFWGEALTPMEESPIRTHFPQKISLSAHVYGPSVYNQAYFNASNFPKNMPAIWDTHFGNVNNATKYATIVGEWGGTYEGKDKLWQDQFAKYLMKKGFGFFYWCLNPTSSDTKGLLKDDWITGVPEKLKMLSPFKGTPVRPYKHHFKRRLL